MSHKLHVHSEQRALRWALFGSVGFVVLALTFALLTRSDAILFDGIYSLIAFCVALLTLKVARLAERPDDDRFHFGYTSMEPALNLFKSLFILVACTWACIEAVKRLMVGGNPAAYGLATVYGAAATLGCLLVAWLMARAGRQTRSDLVAVESRTWLVDGLLSAAVFIGFLLAWWLEGSPWARYAPVVDPLLLIAIVIVALPVPLGILRDSMREILWMPPPGSLADDIEQQLLATLAKVAYDRVEVRITKRGRNTYLLVHIVVSEGFKIQSIADLDAIRHHSEAVLKAWHPEIVMDMLFVRDAALAD
ncbi:cation diffusion facilitator family transporter [Haliea sp. E1-2-M8]|uniref:cation diffusion facilitator family transporter n=1 Tax=Haliea sp. E1-2-M8 TaxID=3064706 RepID=UPI002725AB5B|nr:cation diffusion facilitator family transporter [Haliea sp. E1-2-M8]MDO8862364.1 cation diffusion facilitator family transporter [Haliea sp. E1-2-M8]